MNYEKKYKDAVKKLEKFFTNNDDRILYKHDIENVFPELKESEDERIRKEIIGHFEKHLECSEEYGKEVLCSWIAWLEKQGEQKPTDNVEPKFKVGDTIRPKGSMEEYTIESISGGCYHGKGWGLHISGDDSYELVEQNPAWSEEDEEMFDAIIADIQFTQKAHTHDDNQVVYEREIDWLKSLKEIIKGK